MIGGRRKHGQEKEERKEGSRSRAVRTLRNPRGVVSPGAWPFESMYAWVLKYAFVFRSRFVETEDLIQELCLVALRYHNYGAAYQKKAMRHRYLNVVRSEMRYRYRVVESIDDENFIEPEVKVKDTVEERDLIAHLTRRLDSDKARMILMLLRGSSLSEISILTKVSVRTIYRYVLESRKMLSILLN